MAIYKISEILDFMSSMSKDGYEYVEIDEMEAEDDMPACLKLSALGEDANPEDFIDSVDYPF